jgi:hypothetical protein
MEFCPVCMLRKGLSEEVESGKCSTSEERVKPTPEQAAQRFEHYQLVVGEEGKPIELGRGAKGVTYKAFDVDLHCAVTLKIINEKYLGDESARLRFLREARAAASVRHPNVASVFRLCCSENSFGLETIQGGAGIWLQIHYGHSRNCVTSVIRHLLPIRNSVRSRSTLSHVTPKAPRRCQATLRKFALQNTGACILFEGNFRFLR